MKIMKNFKQGGNVTSVVATKVKRMPLHMYYKRWDQKYGQYFWRCAFCFNELRSKEKLHWYHKKFDYKLVRLRCQICLNGLICSVPLDSRKLIDFKKELKCYHCNKMRFDRERSRDEKLYARSQSTLKRKRSRSTGFCWERNKKYPRNGSSTTSWASALSVTSTLNDTISDGNSEGILDDMNEVLSPVQALVENPQEIASENQISPYGHYLSAADEHLNSQWQWEESLNDLVIDEQYVVTNVGPSEAVDCEEKLMTRG